METLSGLEHKGNEPKTTRDNRQPNLRAGAVSVPGSKAGNEGQQSYQSLAQPDEMSSGLSPEDNDPVVGTGKNVALSFGVEIAVSSNEITPKVSVGHKGIRWDVDVQRDVWGIHDIVDVWLDLKSVSDWARGCRGRILTTSRPMVYTASFCPVMKSQNAMVQDVRGLIRRSVSAGRLMSTSKQCKS
jgi:hypothetical protein